MRFKKQTKKLLSLLVAVCMLIGICPTTAFAASAVDETAANVNKIMSYAAQMRTVNTKTDYTVGGYTWDTEGKKDSWRYFNGVMMDAFMMAGDTAYADTFYSANIADDGTIKNYKANELDSVISARGLFDLLDTTSADKYKKAIQYTYTQLEKQAVYTACGNNYVHKQTGPSTTPTPTDSWTAFPIGLDGLYMAETFLMECANAIDAGTITLTKADGTAVTSTEIYDEVYTRFLWVGNTMYDETTGLYHHGWNPDSNTGNGHFWSRGIGWYAMALVDTISMLPNAYAQQKSDLSYDLIQLFDGMLKYQDASGLWYNVVNRDATLTANNGNRLETSGSAMMAYAMMKAYNESIVTDSKYGEAGLKAFNAVVSTKVTGSEGNYVVTDTYRSSGVCATDNDYCKNPYTDDEAKGTAPLIMAATLANTTASSLPATDVTTDACVTDAANNVSIISSGVTAVATTDVSKNTTVQNALTGLLQDGFYAYDFTVTGYTQGTKATVKMPVPSGVTAENVAVYHVDAAGVPTKITQDVVIEADGRVSFTTDHFSIYAVGTLSPTVGSGATTDTTYEYKLDTDGIDEGAEYLVVYQNGANATSGYAFRNHNGTRARQAVDIANGKATVKSAANLDSCLWNSKNDGTAKLENTTSGGTTYGIKVSNSAILIKGTPTTNASETITATKSGSGYILSKPNAGYLKYSTQSPYWTRTEKEADASVIYFYKKTVATSVGPTIAATLSAEEMPLTVGESKAGFTPEIVITDAAGTTLTYTNPVIDYTSSNPDIVSVDATTGALTCHKSGYARITVTIRTVTIDGSVQNANLELSYGVNASASAIDKTQPTWGRPQNTTPAEYPTEGATRIKKTASTLNQSTGITRVELDVAGISKAKPVDAILIVDVSNSMGWNETRTNGANDAAKIPQAGESDKLDSAMQSASSFADILLTANGNNTLSFVTFAGQDNDRIDTAASGYKAMYDSVQTVFLGETDAAKAKVSFENTKFINRTVRENGTSVDYTLQIGKTDGTVTSGLNRGNTNYDYGLIQGLNAAWNLQQNYETENGKSYAESGRETVILFMTDGAPSHYNGHSAQGKNNGDLLYASTQTATEKHYYDGNRFIDISNNNQQAWTDYITSTPNDVAEYIFGPDAQVSNVTMKAIGFDLAHGGFSTYTADEATLRTVLQNLGGTNNPIDTTLAKDAKELEAYYKELARGLVLAGTEAEVVDEVKDVFTLSTDGPIKVESYELYDDTNAGTTHMIGDRTGVSTLLETVTFETVSGVTKAYSEKGTEKVEIPYTTVDGVTTLKATYFTYTKAADGKETFQWKIGDITDDEIALSYDAYLKSSMEGQRDYGVYDTNEVAVLKYIDNQEMYVEKEFPIPKVAWGNALTQIEYYLVNEQGITVNTIGQEVPFANRIIIPSNNGLRTLNWNQQLTVNAAAYAPAGYEMFSPTANYSVISYSGQQGTSELAINDTKANANGAITTIRLDNDASCAQTKVAVAVIARGIQNADFTLEKDQIVMDYGKAIPIDVLASETAIPTDYTPSVAGFAKYDAAADLTVKVVNAGSAVYNGEYGQFTIVDGQVQYKLNKMLDGVEQIFAVVKITKNDNADDFYYLFNPLDIIPATSMYYETDFAANIFTTTNNWDTPIKDATDQTASQLQDDGTVGHAGHTYGYDSSYADDSVYSNGTSMKATGAMDMTQSGMDRYLKKASFTFKGEGFELISRTGENQGYIKVQVIDKATNTVAKSITVNNKSESQLELYQIPVVSVNDLPYGQYEVIIGINEAYTDTKYPALSFGGEFFFDAVRIFTPVLESESIEAKNAYMADNESNTQVFEIKQLIKNQNGYYIDEADNVGAVTFVDRNKGSVDQMTYQTIGPNNEVYLTADQGIVFAIEATEIPDSIDIGAKSADGTPVELNVILSKPSDDTVATTLTKTISTCTALNYDVMEQQDYSGATTLKDVFELQTSGTYKANMYITASSTSTNILSITDLKVGYGSKTATVNLIESTAAVSRYMNLLPEEAPSYDIVNAVFTSENGIYRKEATLNVTTSDAVKKLQVYDVRGTLVSSVATPVTEGNQTNWEVKFKLTRMGKQTYTIVGLGSDGTEGAPATAQITVTRK